MHRRRQSSSTPTTYGAWWRRPSRPTSCSAQPPAHTGASRTSACSRTDGTILEGFIDLIYREDDGSLVVVDYKTDDITPEAVPARAAYYAPQMTAYANMLSSATSGDVHTKLLFLATPGNNSIEPTN